MSDDLLNGISWLGHASFQILDKNLVVYIDPFKISEGLAGADLILVTHEHFDHLSIEDMRKVMKNGTTIIAPEDCADKFNDFLEKYEDVDLQLMAVGDAIDVEGVNVEAVSAYNTNKDFHTQNKNWVGYVITIGGRRIYHAGDTDLIPEMGKLGEVDIALLPVSGKYVMTAEEAAEAVEIIDPKVVVPMHYDSIVGTKNDALRFEKLCSGRRVALLERKS
jgi:L-ascorbate metabolism protein UlaG (beta-lactamase superfamily)